jgi:hypothetical protein
LRLQAVAAAIEDAAAQQDAVTIRSLVAAVRQRSESALAELKSLSKVPFT